MADFRILKDARAWFKDVYSKDEGFTIDFEVYYFCLMAGLATGQKRSDLSTTETTELVQNFPGNYKDKGKIIPNDFVIYLQFEDFCQDCNPHKTEIADLCPACV